MCLCTLCASRFLRSVHQCELFQTYCRERGVSFPEQIPSHQWEDAVRLWTTIVTELPGGMRERIEWEQAAVIELSSREGITHLLDMEPAPHPRLHEGSDRGAVALWFLLHRTDLFREVYFHHESREIDDWYIAQSLPGVRVSDVAQAAANLADALGALFQQDNGTRCICTVTVHQLPNALCFCGRIPTRPWFIDGVSGWADFTSRHLSGALCIHFAYYAEDGTVLLQSPLRSIDRVQELLAHFGQAVLGAGVEVTGKSFALDQLKFPFHPQPDADDMEMVRVKALQLRYPGRVGRPRLTLETLTSSGPMAIDDLLREHVSDTLLADLHVVHAELQVRLRVENRGKNYFIRLWPNRCDVGRGDVGDRFLSCLRRWGLT